MSWRYQVVRRKYTGRIGGPDADEEYEYGIYEAHVNRAGEVHSITTEPINVTATSPDVLQWMLGRMLEAAADHGVMDYDGPFAKADS